MGYICLLYVLDILRAKNGSYPLKTFFVASRKKMNTSCLRKSIFRVAENVVRKFLCNDCLGMKHGAAPAHLPLEEMVQRLIMRTTENEHIWILRFERCKIRAENLSCFRLIDPTFFDEGYKERTCLLHHAESGAKCGKFFDVRTGRDSASGANNADASIARMLDCFLRKWTNHAENIECFISMLPHVR